jgi:hypothetical protein
VLAVRKKMLLESFLDSFRLDFLLEEKKKVGIVWLLIQVVFEFVLVGHGFDDVLVDWIPLFLIRCFTVINLLYLLWGSS